MYRAFWSPSPRHGACQRESARSIAISDGAPYRPQFQAGLGLLHQHELTEHRDGLSTVYPQQHSVWPRMLAPRSPAWFPDRPIVKKDPRSLLGAESHSLSARLCSARRASTNSQASQESPGTDLTRRFEDFPVPRPCAFRCALRCVEQFVYLPAVDDSDNLLSTCKQCAHLC